MIKIICIGKIKEKYFIDAINEYCKRLQKYTKLKIIELPDEGLVEKTKAINNEGENILKHLDSKDYIISMDIAGKQMSSIDFAKKIDGISQFNSNITFIIGGSYGLSDKIKDLSNFKMSFSEMTFPHQLFRVILLEQIYRSYKINNNEQYHK